MADTTTSLSTYLISSDVSNGKIKNSIKAINTLDKAKFPDFEYELEPNFEYYSRQPLPKRQFCGCVDNCSQANGCMCINLSTIRLKKRGRVQDIESLSENSFDSILFECTSDCACAGKCSNFLATPELQQNLQLEIIRKPKPAGYVCRTLQPICKGTFVCFLAGDVFSGFTNEQIPDGENCCFTFQDKDRELAFSVRMDRISNESRFFNSACCPNLVPVQIFRQWLTPERPMVAFVAKHEINPKEELTFYYGDHWIMEELLKNPKFTCQCNSIFCIWPARREEIKNKEEFVQHIKQQIEAQDRHRARERRETTKNSKNTTANTMRIFPNQNN